MNFATMVAKLNLNIENFSSGLKAASEKVSSFASSLSSEIDGGMTNPAKRAGVQFKDVSRIVQGIIISKVFYEGLNAIRSCVSAVWDFSTSLEYAKIAYANLFKSTDVATEFVNVLQDFAAKTPFTFQQASDAAKRLLAYGVQARNVMYVMQGVLDASAITGDPRTVEAVSRAFGQIVTKGRLMNEEMRQLTDAGIPAYDILKKKLGLTQKQLQNLGRTSISSATAINALVEGLNERYGSAVQASALTMKGLISNIADDAKYLASEIFEPITAGIRSQLVKLESFMQNTFKLFESGGLGAVFERLIPKSMQGPMRQFIAELEELWNNIKEGLSIVKTFISYAAQGAVKVLNIILPIIVSVTSILNGLFLAISRNKTAMNLLSYVLGVAAIAWVTFASKAVLGFILKPLISTIKNTASALFTLGKALISNPILTILSLVFIALAGITLSSTKAGKSLRGFFKQLTDMNGVKTDNILLPKSKQRASDLGKFNNKLTDTSKGMKNLADNTKKATKAAKEANDNLMSFDEVFQIKDKNANVGADTGALSGLGNLGNLGSLNGGKPLDLSKLMPKSPDFLKFGTGLASRLWDAIKGALPAIGVGAGIGTIIGGIIGGALGGLPGALLGAKIGFLAGSIIGLIWHNLTTPQKWSVGIGAGAGTIIGGIIGTLISPGLGTAVGAALGAVGGGVIGYFWSNLTTPQKWSVGIGGGAGTIIGGIIGTLISPGLGTAIGAALGAAGGSAIGYFWSNLTTPQKWSTGIGGGAGTIIGGIIGTLISPGLGTIIGMALGGAAGSAIGYFWNQLTTPKKWSIGVGSGVGTVIGGIIGTIISPGLGTAIGAALGGIAGSVIGNFWQDIQKKFNEAKQGLENTWSDVGGWWNSNVWTPIGNKAGETKDWLGTKFTEAHDFMQTKWNDTTSWWNKNVWTPLGDEGTSWKNVAVGAFETAKENMQKTWAPVQEWWNSNVWTPIKDKATDVKKHISQKFDEAKSNIQTAWQTVSSWWNSNVWTPLQTKANDTKDNISKKFNEAKSNVQTTWQTVSSWWNSNVWTPLQTKANEVKDRIGQKFNDAKTNVQNAWNPVKTWFGNKVWGPLGTAAGTVRDKIQTVFSDALNKIKDTWKDVAKWFSDKVWGPLKDGFGKVGDWFKGGFKDIKNGLDKLAQKGSKITGKKTSHGTASVWSSDYANGGIVNKMDKVYRIKPIGGHAVGGIFGKEHIARFAEGNKKEAIIPLENAAAMNPFADAIAKRIVGATSAGNTGMSVETLSDLVTNSVISALSAMQQANSQTQRSGNIPVVIQAGTVIADDRSLRQLNRKLQVINMQENKR